MKLPTGKGRVKNERELANKVRNLTLSTMYKVLQGNDEVYKKELVLKLASTVLPRINEHSGPDGKPIPLFDNITKIAIPINNSH